MSVSALYRVMVRMLYDGEFARAVYADPAAALAGIDLPAEAPAWLVAPDARAWRTDAMRRARSLTGLVEEFPVASAFVLRGGREGVVPLANGRLDAFFSHPVFHRCVQEGESMVLAFGRYLELPEHGGEAADPRVAPLARLETAIARLRRVVDPREDPKDPSSRRVPAGPPAGRGPTPAVEARFSFATAPGRCLRLATWSELVVLPAGTSELHARVSKALRARDRQPAPAVLDRQWSLPVLLELDFAVGEPVLVERPPVPGASWESAGVRHAPVTTELAGLLRAASTGATRAELMAAARALGADPGEDAEVVDGLVAEGLLVSAG